MSKKIIKVTVTAFLETDNASDTRVKEDIERSLLFSKYLGNGVELIDVSDIKIEAATEDEKISFL